MLEGAFNYTRLLKWLWLRAVRARCNDSESLVHTSSLGADLNSTIVPLVSWGDSWEDIAVNLQKVRQTIVNTSVVAPASLSLPLAESRPA